MSVSFKVEDVSISAKRDRAMFNTFAGNHSYIIQGIGDELSVTSSSSSFVVSIGTGEAVICGGSMLSEGSATTLTLSENQSGYLVIRIDLSQTGDNICKFTNVSSLVQEEINDDGLIYDLPLYTYTTNTNGVSAISDVREIVASSSVYVTETLARVATTGSYTDLSNRPTIPSVDSALSSTSTNPVQNRVINTALSGKANTPDSALSSTSTNPVQNKVINTALSGKASSSHTHGNITNGGDITANATIANGDRLIINDESESKLANSSITFDGTTTTSLLSRKGTWTTAVSLFKILYPIGSIYATYTNTNPSTIIGGTWELLNSSGKVDVGGTIKGNGKVLGLQDGSNTAKALVSVNYAYNGAHMLGIAQKGTPDGGSSTNLINTALNTTDYTSYTGTVPYRKIGLTTTAANSGIEADTITCYLWRRTA